MRTIWYPFRLLWRIWLILVFAIAFVLAYPFFRLFFSRTAWYRHAFIVKRIVATVTSLLTGIRIKTIMEAPLNRERTYVIISNHTSYLDVIVPYIYLPLYYHFLGKQELGRVPLFNILFKKTNILLDRSSPSSAHHAYLRAAKDIREGISIFLFPEATIPGDAPNLKRFKAGAARLAIETQVPILPITYLDHWQIFPEGPNRWKGGKPGISRIVIHAPIETTGMTSHDVGILTDRIFNLTKNTLQQYKVLPLSP